jgi:hypothetical protein
MAGTTTGLEPATSAVTVLRRRKHLSTTNECKRHAEIMFVRLWPLSSVHYLFPSNLESASRNGKGCQGYDTSHNTNPKGSELSRGTRPGGIWMHLPVPGSEKIKKWSGFRERYLSGLVSARTGLHTPDVSRCIRVQKGKSRRPS